MFTGLVASTGALLSTVTAPAGGPLRLTLAAPTLAGRWQQGDSIAVNGVCLTAIPLPNPDHFAADLAEETVRRTTLAQLAPGATVNLELPTPAGAPLGGHVVQGHVDGTATLLSLTALSPDPATSDWRLTVALAPELARFVLSQGSITLDGISLTVAQVHPAAADGTTTIEVAVIPHTYRSTHLHTLAPGARLNVETDVLAKYAGRHAAPAREWLTGAYLLANGY